MTARMRSRKLTDISKAVEIYYKNTEIGTNEIKDLFGSMSSATMAKLRRVVREEMKANNIQTFSDNALNTETAYRVWGLDINDLERRLKQLQKHGLLEVK